MAGRGEELPAAPPPKGSVFRGSGASRAVKSCPLLFPSAAWKSLAGFVPSRRGLWDARTATGGEDADIPFVSPIRLFLNYIFSE